MEDSRRRSAVLAGDDIDPFDQLLVDDDEAPAPFGASARSRAARSRPIGARVLDAPPASQTGRLPATGARPVPVASPATPTSRLPRMARLASGPNWSRIGAAMLLLGALALIIWFAVSSVRESRRQAQYRAYFGKVRTIAQVSEQQGEELQTLLTDQEGSDRGELLAGIERIADRARELERDAAALETPGALDGEHGEFQQALGLRTDGLGRLQGSLTRALASNNKETAAESVASAAQRLVASDVVYADAFEEPARASLEQAGITGVSVPESEFVVDPELASPSAIEQMLERLRSGAGRGPGERGPGVAPPPAPNDGKTRGGQLEAGQLTVAPSGRTLSLDTLNEIPGNEGTSFTVPFTNQGEVQLAGIPVTIVISGPDTDAIEIEATIEKVDPGQTATVQVPLVDVPTFGAELTMKVTVAASPGEEKLDNNTATYPIRFTSL